MQRFTFLKGERDALGQSPEDFDWEDAAGVVQTQISDALNARHLSFLIGSGCSSLRTSPMDATTEIGIPTMGPMATGFLDAVGANEDDKFVSPAERKELVDILGLNLSNDAFRSNLERMMEVLQSAKSFLDASGSDDLKKANATLERVMRKVVAHILELCSREEFSAPDHPVLALYQKFYRRLALRDRSLPRPWVFTTNYDLFNERAMDRAAIPYFNGFSGSVERRFNPAIFRYAMAEQLDISSKRWAAVDSFVYLCKLHGSINWIETPTGLFPIQELQQVPDDPSSERVMIYPTPAKQNTSFGAPYSDLFREFQKQVVRDQSVLVVAGYGFGDEHINNIIFQALTIPGFRLIALVDPDANATTKALRNLGDPRIWFVWGDGPEAGSRAHYFSTFVNQFLPEGPGEKIDTAVEKVLKALAASTKPDALEG